MADDVSVVFSAQIGQLVEGVEAVKTSIESIAEPISALTGIFGTVSEAFLAAFAVDKIGEFFSHFAELAEQTNRQAALLGRPTEEIAGLSVAAKLSGGSIDGLVTSMERLGQSLAKADAGSAQAVAGLNALGISVKQFQGLSPEQQLETLADKFSHLKDGIDKDAIAMAILGRQGAEMIPLLNKGAEGFREASEMAERAGTVMSGEVVAGFERTTALLVELGESFKGAGISVATIFKPAFDGVVKIITDIVEEFNDSIRSGGVMKGVLTDLATVAKQVASAFVDVKAAIEAVWSIGKLAATELAQDWKALGEIIYNAFTGNFTGVQEAWAKMLDQNAQAQKTFLNEIVTTAHQAGEEMRTIWNEEADGEVKVAQDKSARLNIVNKENVQAAQAAAQERIKVAELEYQQTAEKLSNLVKTHQMTEEQRTTALLAALDKRNAAELGALNQEEADLQKLGALTGAAYQKIETQKTTIVQKGALDRLKIEDQEQQQEVAEWNSALSSISASFNSHLRQLLAGTQNFAQVWRQMLGDMIIKFIEFEEEIVVRWLAGEAQKTAGSLVGIQTRAAAEAAASVSSTATQMASTLSIIAADAAKTFAGVFAFLAPAMGPAAAGPATAAQAQVMSVAAVPLLDVGTNTVLSGGFAYIHAGETVIPAAQTSGPYQAPAGPNGNAYTISPTIHINLPPSSALTPANIKQVGRQIAQEVASQFNNNPTLRPKY